MLDYSNIVGTNQDILVLRERGVFTMIAIVHSKMFKELINIVALRKQYCMSL